MDSAAHKDWSFAMNALQEAFPPAEVAGRFFLSGLSGRQRARISWLPQWQEGRSVVTNTGRRRTG